MSEPGTTSSVTEGGGPPIEPPSIGRVEKPFEGLDGKRYENMAPPPAKARQRRRAAPADAATALTPTDPGQTAAPAATPESTPAPEQPQKPTGLEALRRPGESDTEFYPRIHQEDRARIHNLTRSQEQQEQRFETALRQAVAEIQRLSSLVEPVVTRQAKEDQQRQQEEFLSRLPDRETQRDDYNTLVVETALQQLLQMQEEQRQAQIRAQQEAQQREQLEHAEAYFAERDEAIRDELNWTREQDADFDRQLVGHLQLTAYQLRQYDPSMSDEEVEALTYMSHLSEMVEAKNRGLTIGDYYRQQWQWIRDNAPVFMPQQPNGNGSQPVSQPAQQPPAPAQESPSIGSPTAARVAREAARTATAAGGPGRPGGTPGEVAIPTRVYKSEDEYLTAGLRGQFDEDWIRQALGKPAGERSGRRRG